VIPLPKMVKNALLRGLRRAGFDLVKRPRFDDAGVVRIRDEFAHVQFAGAAIQALLDCYDFTTVLDIGCGSGEHTQLFLAHGKDVTAIDYGASVYFERKPPGLQVVLGDFNTLELGKTYDCVWASHVLEHQPDVHRFLRKVHSASRDGGIVAITVPPLKHQIVGGHLSLWNAGLLLYHMVFAGFDCRQASILRYGYNISLIVKKESFAVPPLVFDKGDIDRLSQWLPPGCREGFNGDIARLNWPERA
jgi:SAM-dependent methyltransferase